MSDAQRMLERAGDRFEMPEPAMDRLLRRRERRQRNERIAAAAVGLGVAGAGIVGVVVTLRVAAPTGPAAGAEPTAAADGGGLVLPTIAVWIAIVALGLTAFAAVRLRARFAGLDDDVEHEPTERDGAVAPARRRTAEPGSPRRTGGTDMDSKPKVDVVGLAGAEVPATAFGDGRLRRTNRWLIGAVVVLAVALVAVGTWAIVDRSSAEEPTPPVAASPEVGPADTEIVGMVQGLHEAMRTDAELAASYFTPDAVMYHGLTRPDFAEGREAIAANIQEGLIDQGFDGIPDVEDGVAQVGDFVIQGTEARDGSYLGVVIYELAPSGLIRTMWIVD
jgi:hypothetical protein